MNEGTQIKVKIIVEEMATAYKPHTTREIIFPLHSNGKPYERPQFVFQQMAFWFLNNFWNQKGGGLTPMDIIFMALKYDKKEAISLLRNGFEVKKSEEGNNGVC